MAGPKLNQPELGPKDCALGVALRSCLCSRRRAREGSRRGAWSDTWGGAGDGGVEGSGDAFDEPVEFWVSCVGWWEDVVGVVLRISLEGKELGASLLDLVESLDSLARHCASRRWGRLSCMRKSASALPICAWSGRGSDIAASAVLRVASNDWRSGWKAAF